MTKKDLIAEILPVLEENSSKCLDSQKERKQVATAVADSLMALGFFAE